VDRLLDGAKIHLVNTDPPYNVKAEPRTKNAVGAGMTTFAGCLAPGATKRKDVTKMRPRDRPIANDNFLSDEEYEAVLDSWFGNIARVLDPGRSFYTWGGYSNCARFLTAMSRHGLHFSQSVIWVKEHPTLNRKDFMANHEWAFYGWKEGAAHKFYGPNNASDTWSVKKVSPLSMVHLTEKPVELAVRAMQYSSLAGENVLDLFGGSGSTLIGAEQTGRKAYLMELDPLYCDVIRDRWCKFTGKEARRVDF